MKNKVYIIISFRDKVFSLFWEDGVLYNPICCYEYDCTEDELLHLIEDCESVEPRRYYPAMRKLNIETLTLDEWIEIDEWARQNLK